MSPAATLKQRVDSVLKKHAHVEHAPGKPTVLVATIDPAIRSGLTELFQAFSFKTIWLQGVEAAKNVLDKEKIAACLCGFWLQDGTYRELIRHIKRGRLEIPTIIVSPPACPEEYGEYLAAMKIGTLDFLCFPYLKTDLERMLRLTLEPCVESMRDHPSTIGVDVRISEAA